MSLAAVIVLGSSNTDLILRLPLLPRRGDTVLGGSFSQAPGGKGANQAVAASRSGRHGVVFLSAVGEDEYGRQRLADLRAAGVVTDYVKVVPGVASGIAMIFVSERGENMIGVAAGANMHLLPDDVDRLPGHLFGGARVFLASLEVPLETVRCGLKRAKEAGLVTILNPAPADKNIASPEFLGLVDWLTPNERELAHLAAGPFERHEKHKSLTARNNWESRAVAALRAKGLKDCIVTRGSKGCVVFSDQRSRQFRAMPGVRAVDTTAAGDAFNGCLATALAEGMPLLTAVRFAIAAAGLSVTRHAAQPSLPQREEIEAALSAWRRSIAMRRGTPRPEENE